MYTQNKSFRKPKEKIIKLDISAYHSSEDKERFAELRNRAYKEPEDAAKLRELAENKEVYKLNLINAKFKYSMTHDEVYEELTDHLVLTNDGNATFIQSELLLDLIKFNMASAIKQFIDGTYNNDSSVFLEHLYCLGNQHPRFKLEKISGNEFICNPCENFANMTMEETKTNIVLVDQELSEEELVFLRSDSNKEEIKKTIKFLMPNTQHHDIIPYLRYVYGNLDASLIEQAMLEVMDEVYLKPKKN